MDSKAQRIIKRNEQMSSSRRVNDSLMRDIALHVQPRKANSILSDNTESSTDEVDRLHDTTAMFANQTLASGMNTHITPAGQVFATFGPPSGPDGEEAGYDVKNWFHKATKTFHEELTNNSNFQSAVDELYLDHGGFGTAAMICRMGRSGKLVFETIEIGSYSIAEGEDRSVDTLYREYELTPRQIMQRFDDVPDSVKEKNGEEKTKDIPLKIIHAIEPREDYDSDKIDDKNMPIASVYVLAETQEILHESGFYEQPFAVSRWRLWGKSPWGWSPSYYALPLANQLNFLEQCVDVGVERVAFPAWMVPNTMKGEFDPRPHGQNIYDASGAGDNALPQELQTHGRIDIAMDRVEQKREVIREAFFEDLFKLLSRTKKELTAYETREVIKEKTSQFQPFFGRITSEFVCPIFRRAFAELLRAGKFGTPPEGLFVKVGNGWEMQDPKIEFNSPMAMALQLGEVSGLLQTIEDLAPMAQVVGPHVYDFVDEAKAGPMIARARGVSPDVMRSAEEMEALREQRAQAEQQAAQAEQAQQLASAVGSLGGVGEAQNVIDV